MKFDWMIVGAGFTGAVLAERIASQLGQKVLIVEQRNHIAGNAYDDYDEHGVLIHHYGPHIFHTNARYIWDYLSQFTTWRPYYHRVLGVIDGQTVPIPFNLNSLYALFPPRYADKLAEQLIQQYGFNVKVPILKIKEEAEKSGQADLKFLADYIYRNVFHNYTLKQWDLTPEQLSPSVTARVPIYVSRDDRYFQDSYQGMPAQGYTALFKRLLAHPNIKVLLNADYREIAALIPHNRLIYTGAIDDFFDHVHGELPYRSLAFKFTHHPEDVQQAVGTVNYPNEYQYTRITEFKHLTGQRIAGSTCVAEYPQAYRRGENIPYYPIPRDDYREQYHRYLEEAKKCNPQVIFAGRLADYQYYNMDQAVARALTIFKKNICAGETV
ncbi:UDP-galactopyranose mutase [Thioflexithrix psekupsensis]|uniref:UDP-galactopyranose mutase n=1 Tax=Thioflexithrix psekupsensis TaxID=1570016 RepID=A0A251X5L1_9GAMM|nr:UDP-galactopyranose mutase [Thioflexithrix psekupsensis]OUD12388.1 UDP-galactopyranose mutase [Thioflexithrix psekupsensis]